MKMNGVFTTHGPVGPGARTLGRSGSIFHVADNVFCKRLQLFKIGTVFHGVGQGTDNSHVSRNIP